MMAYHEYEQADGTISRRHYSGRRARPIATAEDYAAQPWASYWIEEAARLADLLTGYIGREVLRAALEIYEGERTLSPQQYAKAYERALEKIEAVPTADWNPEAVADAMEYRRW